MPITTLSVSPASGGAISTWSGYEAGYGDVRYTTPTTDGFLCTVSVPPALRGATFNSAALSCTASGNAGTVAKRYYGTSGTVTDANLLQRLQNGETEIKIYFSYRANAGGGIGAHSATYSWSDITVTVDYTPAAAITGEITLGTASRVSYATDCKSLCGAERAEIALTVEPDAAITGLRLDLGDSAHVSYDSFTADVAVDAGGNADVTLTLALDEASLAARVNAAYIRITLITAAGNEISAWTQLGSMKLLSSRVAPALSAAFSDTAGHYDTYGAYLQTLSLLRCAITAALDTDADADISVQSRQITVAEVSYTSGTDVIDIGAVNGSGSVAYTVSVTDSYGQTGTLSGTLTFLPYALPAFTLLSLERYNATTLELDDTADTVWLNALGAVSPLNGANAWTLKAAYTNGSDSGTVNIASGADGVQISYTRDTAAFRQALSAAYEWEVTVTLADSLSSAVYTLTVPKSGGILSIEKHGVAIGKRSTGNASEDKFEVSYNAYFGAHLSDEYGTALLTGDDSSWHALTLTNCTQDTDYQPCAVRRIGEIVYLRGAVQLTSQMPSSGTNPRILATLPAAYRPAEKVLANAAAKPNVTSIEIDTTGEVKLWNRVGAALGLNEPVSLNLQFFL